MKNESTIKRSKKQQGEDITLLQAIERVVELSKDSKMSTAFMKKAAPEIKMLAERFGITERQAVLFCVCMYKGPCSVDYSDLAIHLGISIIASWGYADDITSLVHRRLLRFQNMKNENVFDIPAEVLRCLKHNKVYELPKRKDLDCIELFNHLEQLFEDLDNRIISIDELAKDLYNLFEDNPQVGFVQKMKELNLDDESLLLLTLFCHLLINNYDNSVGFNEIKRVIGKRRLQFVISELRNGTHCLQRQDLVENCCEHGMINPICFQLTSHAKRTLLSELMIEVSNEVSTDLLTVEQLKPKTLFYPEGIRQQVDELTSFLQPEVYRQIHKRMEEQGFRSGFACLFYGGPGTGKTETVYQLARLTGRSIMVVDVPQIKSKWVGESEKNIKALFDRYRELVKRSEHTPILLFNEADAIISTRMNGAQNAVDKMENSIQNIILQEMESLDGIMIATTNLQQNLDPAFERRFLYKIRFEKPDQQVRSHIWQTMIPALTEQEAIQLAVHDFSGGQIENIARKHAIHVILHGNDDTSRMQHLLDFCATERLAPDTHRRIGF